MTTCYRHADRETGVSCSRCGRPICPDCMTTTSVGMRCPECAGDSTKVRRPAFAAGASSAAPATVALIAINVVAFLVQILFGGGGFGGFGSVYRDGALSSGAVGDGEWWRVITSGFLHADLIHLGLNMLVLFFLGRVLEPMIGTPRFVAVYLVSLVAGSLGALLLTDPSSLTVGASGAIYGVFGATLLIARERGHDALLQQLGFWLVLNLVLTFSRPGISIGGHLGGLAAGALAGMLVIAVERRIGSRGRLDAQLAALAALGIACFVAAVLVAGAGAHVDLLSASG